MVGRPYCVDPIHRGERYLRHRRRLYASSPPNAEWTVPRTKQGFTAKQCTTCRGRRVHLPDTPPTQLPFPNHPQPAPAAALAQPALSSIPLPPPAARSTLSLSSPAASIPSLPLFVHVSPTVSRAVRPASPALSRPASPLSSHCVPRRRPVPLSSTSESVEDESAQSSPPHPILSSSPTLLALSPSFPPARPPLRQLDWPAPPHPVPVCTAGRRHFITTCTTGDNALLLRTGGSDEEKLAIADAVVGAVMDVVRMDAADIARRVVKAMREENEERYEWLVRELGEARVVVEEMGAVTVDRWRQVFHPDRLVKVTVWDESEEGSWERLWRAEAGAMEAAFLNFRPWPRGPAQASSYRQWVVDLAQKTEFHKGDGRERVLLDCGPLRENEDERVVWLDDSASSVMKVRARELKKRRYRSVLQLPDVNREETVQIRKKICKWQVRGEMKANELLLDDDLRDSLQIFEHALLSDELSAVFLTHGPSCNSAHVDSIGGGSCCVFGWKVVVMWDALEWEAGVGRKAGLGDVAPPLSILDLIRFPSLRWTLIGPGTTIVLPADRPHFVIALSSSLLITFSSTSFPHRMMRSMALVFAGRMTAKGTWMEAQQPTDLTALIKYLRHRMTQVLPHWSTHKRRVSSEEWQRMRGEVAELMQISPLLDSLPGLKDVKDRARYESELAIK